MSRVVVVPTVTTTSVTFTLLKPLGAVSREYEPTTGKAENRYTPDGVVTVLRLSPVAALVSVTGAFDTTAPEGSVTRPVNSPTPPCAHIVPSKKLNTNATSRERVRRLRETCS